MFFYSPKLLLLALFFLGNFWQCASFQIPPSDQLKDVRHINKKIPDADVSIASTAAGDAVGVKYTCESYKEASRKFRRTVYDHEKWYKHRSSERHVKNLLTMFSSGLNISNGFWWFVWKLNEIITWKLSTSNILWLNFPNFWLSSARKISKACVENALAFLVVHRHRKHFAWMPLIFLKSHVVHIQTQVLPRWSA